MGVQKLKSEQAESPCEPRHIIQMTDSKGVWKDYAPGAPPVDLETTIQTATALKPDGRRMRVVTFTQTEVYEVP